MLTWANGINARVFGLQFCYQRQPSSVPAPPILEHPGHHKTPGLSGGGGQTLFGIPIFYLRSAAALQMGMKAASLS